MPYSKKELLSQIRAGAKAARGSSLSPGMDSRALAGSAARWVMLLRQDWPLGTLLHPIFTYLSLYRLYFSPSQQCLLTNHLNVLCLGTDLG